MFIGDPTPLSDGRHVAHVHREDGFCYVTDPQAVPEDAILEAKKWAQWHDALQAGQSADTVYYIVSISPIWPGPASVDHRYSGLQVKIGRAKDVMRRLADLRTGASGDLIIHALEPGGAAVEAARHAQFADERRTGEWFTCSPRLTQHIFKTWYRNNLLPREMQFEVLLLQDRIDALLKARELMGGPPDLVNPSLDEAADGKRVLFDFAYAGWRVSVGRPLRPGAIQLHP